LILLTIIIYDRICHNSAIYTNNENIEKRRGLNTMKLKTFLDYYQPLDSEEKIDKLFALCFNSKFQSICTTDCLKILDVTNEEIRPYFIEKIRELDSLVEQLSKERKKLKKLKKRKIPKRSKGSSSVFNKDGIVYKRIRIISTPM